MRIMVVALVLSVVLFVGWLAWQSAGFEEPVDTAAAPETAEKTAERTAEETFGPEPAEKLSAPEHPPNGEQDPDPEKVLAEMRRVRDCYEHPDCVVGEDTDPRAEYFEAGQRVADGLHALMRAHEAGRLRDGELTRAAREFLEMESGRGRAAAIEALGRVPPSPEHLDALFATLDQHHDEKLFELAMEEFRRYQAIGYRDRIDDFLIANLRTGARFATRAIAENLDAFITPDNEHRYRALLEELQEDSWRAELLKGALRE